MDTAQPALGDRHTVVHTDEYVYSDILDSIGYIEYPPAYLHSEETYETILSTVETIRAGFLARGWVRYSHGEFQNDPLAEANYEDNDTIWQELWTVPSE